MGAIPDDGSDGDKHGPQHYNYNLMKVSRESDHLCENSGSDTEDLGDSLTAETEQSRLLEPGSSCLVPDDIDEGGSCSVWHRLIHEHWGRCLMFTGTFLYVPDATFTRCINGKGMTVSAYRLLFTGMSLLVILIIRYGFCKLLDTFRKLQLWGLFVSILLGVSNVAFIFAVNATPVAHVEAIVGTMSLWGALVSRFILGIEIPCKTWIAIPVVLAGVVITVNDSLNPRHYGPLGIGDVIAFLVPTLGGLRRTIVNWKSNIDMMPAVVVGSISVSAGLFMTGKVEPLSSLNSTPLFVQGFLTYPLSQFTIMEANRYVNSAEAGLILCIETTLSPIVAWAIVGDHLRVGNLIGGALVVITLVVHSLLPSTSSAFLLPTSSKSDSE